LKSFLNTARLYQIRDDIDDFNNPDGDSDLEALRPNILLATAYERANSTETKSLLDSLWRREKPMNLNALREIYIELKADERAKVLLETFKEEAMRQLHTIDNSNLKGLLRRIITKIFNDFQICGLCKEFEEKNLKADSSDKKIN